jgi:hypothetical protein
VESLGFSIYKSCHLQTRILDFLLSNLGVLSFFILPYCAKISNTMLNKSGESGQLVFTDLREMILAFLHSV